VDHGTVTVAGEPPVDLATPDPWELAAAARAALSAYGRHRAEAMAAAIRQDDPAQIAAQAEYRQAMRQARDAVDELARRAARPGGLLDVRADKVEAAAAALANGEDRENARRMARLVLAAAAQVTP